MTAGTNEFLPFGTGTSPNVDSQADYAAAGPGGYRGHGFSAGVADPSQANKAWRQATFIAAGLAQFVANLGINVPDDGDLTTFVTNLTLALKTTSVQFAHDMSASANSLNCVLDPLPASIYDGLSLIVVPLHTNTGSCTLTVGGSLPAKGIKLKGADLTSGQLVIGYPYLVTYTAANDFYSLMSQV